MTEVCRIRAYYSLERDETYTWVAVGDPSRRYWWVESPHSWPDREIAYATIEGIRTCQAHYDRQRIIEFADSLASKQADLPEEASEILYGNLWQLYDRQTS